MHISFTLVLTVLTLALSCVPAVLIWTIFSRLMDSTVDMLHSTATESTDDLAHIVQDLLLSNSLQFLNSRIAAGDSEATSQETLLHATGLLKLNLHPNVTDINAQVLTQKTSYNFNTVKGNPMFSYISVEGAVFNDGDPIGKTSYWIVWQALNVDVYRAQMGLPPFQRTLYLCTVELSTDELWNNMKIWYVDQTTGTPLVLLSEANYPWQGFYVERQDRQAWCNDLYVNPYSGQVELCFVKNIVHGNQLYSIGMGLNTQTLSEELRTQLDGQPTDRLFIFFRTSNGHLIAASHGKYHSLSDVDSRFVNPLANPPNLSAYKLYTCLDSTDALIREACQTLVAQAGPWPAIPEGRREAWLGGARYWVVVGHSTSSLNATVVLLKNRESVMGSIDASTAKVMADAAAKRNVAALVFGVATAVAAVMPLLIGLWLGRRLLRLAKGMDRIAQLDFSGPSISEARFREIHNFQQSFRQMERGLRAFGQFVPQAVVTQLVAGRLRTDDEMANQTVTVAFADIEGFSTWAERLAPSQLAQVCTEYFEVMCQQVVACDGTIDKFIGDCLMAMWNAPLPRPGHERRAVTAALHMQAEVLGLHAGWLHRGLPALKFRMGLHTGKCLVGNFGCSYRVSYTCLGDTVNLASRLEALNKKFSTTLCVSEATHAGCRDDFHFRHLSKVAVPGRSEMKAGACPCDNLASRLEALNKKFSTTLCVSEATHAGCRDDFHFRHLSKVAAPGRSEALSVYEVLCAADPAEVVPDSPSSLSMSMSFTLTRPMLELRVESAEGPLDGDAAPARSRLSPPLHDPKNMSFESDDRGSIPYHWGYRERCAVLREAAEYEAAYTALLAGQATECQRALAGHPADRAWEALAAQLERQSGSSQPWDGVLCFPQK